MKVGDKAPEVWGVNQEGKEVKLSDYKGRKVALYFYPKTIRRGVRPRHVVYATDMTSCVRPVTKLSE